MKDFFDIGMSKMGEAGVSGARGDEEARFDQGFP